MSPLNPCKLRTRALPSASDMGSARAPSLQGRWDVRALNPCKLGTRSLLCRTHWAGRSCAQLTGAHWAAPACRDPASWDARLVSRALLMSGALGSARVRSLQGFRGLVCSMSFRIPASWDARALHVSLPMCPSSEGRGMSSTLRSSCASRSARAARAWRVLLYRSAHATRGAQCRLPGRPRRRAPQPRPSSAGPISRVPPTSLVPPLRRRTLN